MPATKAKKAKKKKELTQDERLQKLQAYFKKGTDFYVKKETNADKKEEMLKAVKRSWVALAKKLNKLGPGHDCDKPGETWCEPKCQCCTPEDCRNLE